MNSVIGTVVEIDLLNAKIKTPAVKKALMAYGSLMQSSVINHSASASLSIEAVVGVSYDDDIEEAEVVTRD